MQKHVSSFETSFDKMLVILKLNRKSFFCHKFSIWKPTNEQKSTYYLKTGFMIFSNNYISCIWNQFPSLMLVWGKNPSRDVMRKTSTFLVLWFAFLLLKPSTKIKIISSSFYSIGCAWPLLIFELLLPLVDSIVSKLQHFQPPSGEYFYCFVNAFL